MKNRHLLKFHICVILSIAAVSCSTTRVIPEGESRLVSNKLIIKNNNDSYPVKDLNEYIKQKPNTNFILGWNPFINIYNWENGKGKGWDKFVHKLGQKPVILDENLVESSCENLLNHLEYKGYYNSHVNDSIVTRNKKSTVYYTVTLGKRYTIDSISYSIENDIVREYVMKDTSNSTIRRGDVLSESDLETESQRVASYMNNNGFYTFSKNHLFFEADTFRSAGNSALEISVRDYTRNESPSDSLRLRQYKFGKVYMTPVRRVSASTRYRLRRDSIENKLDTVNHRSVNIISAGKPLVRKSVLNRMNTIHTGDLYSQDAVAQTYKKLSNLGIFSSVNVQLEEKDSAQVETNIRLTPSALQGYKVNLEMSSNSSGLLGISPAISYSHKNLFRGGETFSLSFMGNFQFQFNSDVKSTEFGISSSLSVPNFLLLPDSWFKSGNIPRTEFILSYNYQDRPEYMRNIISASYGYTWSVANKYFFKVSPVQLSIVKLFNLSPEFYESLKDPFIKNSYNDHFDAGLGASFYYTTNSAVNPTSSYFYLRWQNDISGNLISLFNNMLPKDTEGNRTVWGSPYSQYVRSEISAVYTWIFGSGSNQSLASRLLIGVGTGYGNSVALPFEKLFWSGGAYSLRAWQARSVGPGNAIMDDSFSIPNQTGNIKIEANIEYRFPLFWSIEGAAFIDIGNVWTSEKSSGKDHEGIFRFNSFYKQLAADWGIGVRLNLGFTLLRLDCGFKIHDPSYSNSWLSIGEWFRKSNYGIQFGVGYPF